MTAMAYLTAIRRRWKVVAATTLIALVAALVVTRAIGGGRPQGAAAPPAAGGTNYSASAIILSTSGAGRSAGGGGGLTNLETLKALTTVGVVPQKAAEALDEDDPSELVPQVETVADTTTGLLTITARSGDPERAEEMANAFARALVKFVEGEQKGTVEKQIAGLEKQKKELEKEIEALEAKSSSSSSSAPSSTQSRGGGQSSSGSSAQREDASREIQEKETQLRTLDASIQQMQSNLSQQSGIQLIQEATARESTGDGTTFEAPRGKGIRLLLALLFGLGAGIALVILMERFDSRVRTKEAAEQHFGLPVLAEVPIASRARRRRLAAAVATAPTSRWAHAYRLLVAHLSRPPVRPAVRANGADAAAVASVSAVRAPAAIAGTAAQPKVLAEDHALADVAPTLDAARGAIPRSILVVSPGSRDGRTTVVSNLAVALSEIGHRVMVLSCDFHDPAIHSLLEVPNQWGLAEALRTRSNGTRVLDGHVRRALVGDLAIDVVTSGSAMERPSELLASTNMQRALAEANGAADVVLIDSAPLLVASETTHLFPRVDAVLVVAHAGQTTARVAEHTGQLLRRLDAPVVGVVLNAAGDVASPRPGVAARVTGVVKNPGGIAKGLRERIRGVPRRPKGFPRLARHSKADYSVK